MSVGTDSPASNSQYLASSHSSLNTAQSKKVSNEISKTYKHASQLYLTRQLAEAYEVLQPVIKPQPHVPSPGEHIHPAADTQQLAPIAIAGTSQRIKIWSLYVTLLNAIVDLGPLEGKQDFGAKEYGLLVRLVQSGDIWEEVVNDGYGGQEGNVDAEVIYNLSNLLLAQAPNQIVNQTRLETYLASTPGELNLSEHLEQRLGGQSNGRRPHINGASTPKDLTSRIKILELFTLHVLPRNEEWEYAKSFINNSDILDDDRREAFLQTLQELQEAREQEQSTFIETEDEFVDEPEVEESDYTGLSQVNHSSQPEVTQSNGKLHRQSSGEVDYGIDYGHPNGSQHQQILPEQNSRATGTNELKTLAPAPISESTPSIAKPRSSTRTSQSKSVAPASALRRPNGTKSSKPKPKPLPAAQSNTVFRQAKQIFALLSRMSSNISHSLTKDPTAMFRTLMFLVAFLIMLSRRDIRDRIQRILDRSWAKVRSTVGMGVKVSYI